MQELTFEQVESVSGGVAWLPIMGAALTVIAAIDSAIDIYKGYRDGVEKAKAEAEAAAQGSN